MPVIKLETIISAPVGLCFDLSRSIDLHLESTKHTGETAIAGKVSGFIELGETVTWRAKHFYVWQTLTSKITAMEPPAFFVDEMVAGAFRSFRHEHHFIEANGYTLMKDVFNFEAPFGWLGMLANYLFLTNYMKALLIKRNEVIRQHAETANKTASHPI
jgi:ligand-binding SRPBCC domain-containing protein